MKTPRASSATFSSSSSAPSSIRQFGQRSVSSLFLLHAEKKGNKSSGSSMSLIDFLDRRLQQRSQKRPQSITGDKPSERIPLPKVISGANPSYEHMGGIPGSVFQKPKVPPSLPDVPAGDPASGLLSLKRKRIAPNENSQNTSSRVLVVGDEPKPKRSFNLQRETEEKVPTLFNHYADGGGWWDTNMVGLASEEVGTTEMWEGMGSTTIGGL